MDERFSAWRPRRQRWRGVTVRLVAITLVPLLALGAAGTKLIRDRLVVVDRSAEIVRQVEHLFRLVQLRFSITEEASSVQALAQVRGIGLPASLASGFLGFDVEQRALDAAAMVDERSSVVATDPEATAALRRVADLRTRAKPPTVAEVAAAYSAAEALIRQAALSLMADVAEAAAGLPDGGDLQRRTSLLVSAFDASEAASLETGALFDTVAGANLAQDSARLALAEQSSRLQQAIAEVEARVTAGSATGDAVERLTRNVAYVDFEDSVASFLAPGYVTRPNAGDALALALAAAPVFRAAFVRAGGFLQLVEAAGRDVLTEADEVHDRAATSANTTIVLLVAASLGCLVGAFVVGRSMRLPLARLEERASEVLGGATTMSPLPIRGPREVRVVSRAVNVFVANLATVEQQAAALADADLDNPVLAQPATGALGEALHRTFARLTDAMQSQAELRQQLTHDARHDALTGLPNRVAAHEAVRAALHRAEREGSQVALLFVDLDGFKQVNDLHGHGVGDEVLRRTVNRMLAVGRGGDLLARLGGDEFVVVAEPIGDIGEAVAIAERLIATVGEPLDIEEARVGIGASVGVALGSRVTDAATLVTDADLAVYQAKAAGRGRVEVYDRALRNELETRTALEADLRAAIAGEGLSLHYQPIVSSVGRDVGGVEALLRWDRPGHGRVPPAEFIPVAESSALIVDVGRWVLHQAANQWARWQSDPALASLHVSVNVSARHLLSRDFVADVRDALDATGMDPAALIIELTETALLTDLPQASASLGELRKLGIGVALDDFGTGHTSFAYLRHLPIDAIKIDRSYIAGLDDPTDGALTGLMSAMARVLEVDVVAEGVEHAAQLDALTGLGCGLAQGFHICHPLPANEVEDWIRTWDGHGGPASPADDAFIAD